MCLDLQTRFETLCRNSQLRTPSQMVHAVRARKPSNHNTRSRRRLRVRRAYFRPLLTVLTSVPCASSPLNSQKNAPPKPCAFT